MATRVRRGPPLTQEEIVAAALAIADTEGLEAISMRKLAAKLGVGAMTLYHHVADKQELLLLMSDAIGAELLIEGEYPTHWRDALRAIAHNTRGAHERHPWLLDSVSQRPGPTANSLRHIEQSITAVAGLDVDPDVAGTMVLATDDYVIGYVTREAAMARMRASSQFSFLTDRVADLLDSGEFPLLAKVAGDADAFEPPPGRFERGLEWLFDGMEAEIARSASR
jgi:AcrR family transcriptional regulator